MNIQYFSIGIILLIIFLTMIYGTNKIHESFIGPKLRAKLTYPGDLELAIKDNEDRKASDRAFCINIKSKPENGTRYTKEMGKKDKKKCEETGLCYWEDGLSGGEGGCRRNTHTPIRQRTPLELEILKRNFPDKVWCPTTNDNSCSEDDFDDN